MPQTVTVAAVRFSNDPAPTDARLSLAAAQVSRAAEAGAQLVVLPELFNTGYVYSNENYARAEPIDGPTVTWMKRLAAEHNIHLAGTLLLLGPEHITNSLILVAPDGRLWRYDKNFPWVWERLYFRAGHDITVARTDIGTFGLMICMDVASPHLFERYAGRVDALIISSSPPRMHEVTVRFPDGGRVTLAALVGFSEELRANADQVFNQLLLRRTAWMGVPVINAVPYGQFSTRIPLPWLSFGVALARKPPLWRYIFQGSRAVATGSYFGDNLIADANGTVLARYDAEADGFALATVELPDSPPLPSGRAPRYAMPPADGFAWLLAPFYRRGIRAAWGRKMAPLDRRTRTWAGLVLGAWLSGYIMGRLAVVRRALRG